LSSRDSPSGAASALAPFRVRAFRFQSVADICMAFALEMENIILGWYILVETKSVVLLTIFAGLQFLGSLVTPYTGMLADRMGRRVLLVGTRMIFTALALLLAVLSFLDALSPVTVFAVALAGGLLKPSELMLRQTFATDILPPSSLLPALGMGRVTLDAARMFGALAGAALFAWLGFSPSYVAVTLLYGGSFALMWAALLGDAGRASAAAMKRPPSPAAGAPARQRQSGWRDMRDGVAYVRNTPRLFGIICLVVAINLCAFPLTTGLLPYVAKEVYLLDEIGYGRLVASHAAGSLVGSLLMTFVMRPANAARLMLMVCFCWQVTMVVFALMTQPVAGAVVLMVFGAFQSMTMVSLTTAVLGAAAPDFRTRVMGVRMLAVYGLPVGLFLSGLLVRQIGFAPAMLIFGAFGIASVVTIGRVWRDSLWNWRQS
jgi:MFS family permease